VKAALMRDMTPAEIHKKLDEIERELFVLGIQVTQQKNTSKIRELRRDRARLKQTLASRGIRVSGSGGRS
jgi:ribosomal protein L29